MRSAKERPGARQGPLASPRTTGLARRLRLLTLIYASALVLLVAAADRGSLIVSELARLPAADKVGHFLLMGLLAYLVNVGFGSRPLRWSRLPTSKGSVLIVLLVTLEEISQVWLPHRSFELADLAADLAGIWVFGRLAAARRQPWDPSARTS